MPRSVPSFVRAALSLAGFLLLTACTDPFPVAPVTGCLAAQTTVQASGSLLPGGISAGTAATTSATTAATISAIAVAQEATPTSANWAAPHVAGEVLLTGQNGKLSAQGLDITALQGVKVQQLEPGLALAFTPAGQSDLAFAHTLSTAGLQTQPNFLYQALDLPLAVNDPGFPDASHAGISVQGAAYVQAYLSRINAAQGWTLAQQCGKSLDGVVTAVLDTGIDEAHPDLQGRVLPGQTFSNDGLSAEGASESVSGNGHGTAVAGLIGATTNNGVGLSGLTWAGQNLLPLRVLGPTGGSTLAIRNALNVAIARGAKVVNMSLGMPGNPGDALLDTALTTAAQSAVLVAAAGNTSSNGIYYPASHPAVLAVGAVAQTDTLACYSARPNTAQAGAGRQLDLLAPGGNAGTSSSITTDGAGCFVTSPDDLLTLTSTALGSYTLRAGTSEATPLVSGAASLVWGVNPALSAAQVRAILLSSARDIGGLKLLDVGAAVKVALQ